MYASDSSKSLVNCYHITRHVVMELRSLPLAKHRSVKWGGAPPAFGAPRHEALMSLRYANTGIERNLSSSPTPPPPPPPQKTKRDKNSSVESVTRNADKTEKLPNE